MLDINLYMIAYMYVNLLSLNKIVKLTLSYHFIFRNHLAEKKSHLKHRIVTPHLVQI